MERTPDGDQHLIRVLLVDDEADFRTATSQVLRRRGFEIDEASSGAEALQRIAAATPDVVLLDLKMPGMDGITTLERIRDISEQLPVIILTGHGQLDDAMAGIQLQIVDFVHKPVDVADLGDRIRRLIASGSSAAPIREKTIAELMVPLTEYRRMTEDRPVADLVRVLRDCMFGPVQATMVHEGRRRTVLVMRTDGRFLGIIRPRDVLHLLVPEYLRDSPYASFFTGMFLAQSKMVGRQTVGDLVWESNARDEQPSISIDAPLMQAVHLMDEYHLINLPVLRDGELVGILRDQDLLLEIDAAINHGRV